MDRPHRPPPLALAPPKRQKSVAVRDTSPLSTGTSTEEESHINEHKRSRSGSSIPHHGDASPSAIRGAPHWIRSVSDARWWSILQIAGDVLHLQLCAVLVAALATFMYEVSGAMASSTGKTATAAITLLSLTGSLSFLPFFLPHRRLPAWALLLRLALATGLFAVFVAWVSVTPGPRVFPRGYRLWNMGLETGDGLVAGTVFVLAVWDVVRVVVFSQSEVLDGVERYWACLTRRRVDSRSVRMVRRRDEEEGNDNSGVGIGSDRGKGHKVVPSTSTHCYSVRTSSPTGAA